MDKKKFNKGLFILLIVFLLIVFALLIVINEKVRNSIVDGIDDVIDVITPTQKSDYDLEALQTMWKENKKISDDYVGQIIFDSGLINVPFVKGYTNETYLRTDWVTGQYDIRGTVFMDSLDQTDDQNITIYGHYVYPEHDPERKEMFTPLEQLVDKDNYKANKHVAIVFKDGVREYDIAAVYYLQLEQNDSGSYAYAREDLQYYWRNVFGDILFNYDSLNISKEYFSSYKKAVEAQQFYSTGVRYNDRDNFVTLQTCVLNNDALREIVILKEVSRTPFEK